MRVVSLEGQPGWCVVADSHGSRVVFRPYRAARLTAQIRACRRFVDADGPPISIATLLGEASTPVVTASAHSASSQPVGDVVAPSPSLESQTCTRSGGVSL